ncbi:MAG: hypothetical protein K6G68_12615 [Oscillospiraceae bacterium]|nr:hypothetical protein [Oscillospiraceae bacterium]
MYGYKISGFASAERFFEAEHFLDRYLKGYEKKQTSFSSDGSRSQKWEKQDGDNTLTVELVKNITESGIMIFSDEEIKKLKHGGIWLYIKDIIPTIIFAAIYWVGMPYILTRVRYKNYFIKIGTLIGLAAVMLILRLIIDAVKKKMPRPSMRTPRRSKFVQYGGVISVILSVFTVLDQFGKSVSAIGDYGLTKGGSYLYFINLFILSPVAVIVMQLILSELIKYIIRNKTNK